MQFAKNYLIAFVVFAVLDLVWLLFISRKLTQSKIGHLMADKVNLPAAIIFYLLYIAALVFFVITPATEKSSVLYALGVGAFLGLVAYGTYDLTNLATLKGWPVSMTVIDLAWGTFVTGSTCAVSTWISGMF
ncbi:MAG: DUF2177 family protein [Clostridiaceae bacterium]|jgi:uncharacterized membrane protein|nr:DUF2177 family protein [Clostridiaceae bacterium]